MGRLPRRTWALLACLPFLIISSVQPVHAGATEWMDLEVVDGYLMIDTEVGGIAGRSIIDTGGQVTAINGKFLESEGLSFKTGRKITVEGVFSKDKRSTYRQVPTTIFGSPVTFSRLVDLDLGPPDIQLLLGGDFLDSYIFQFDYTNERMRLITKDGVDLKALKNVEARKDRDSGSLLVRVNLEENANAWLLMDTGANGGILIDRSFARRLDWIDTYASQDGAASGVISSSKLESFRVPSIQVGPFGIENVLVSIPAPGESPEYFEKDTQTGTRMARRNASDGLLGYDILKHFVVTIDYDRGYVHFYPGEEAP